MNFYPRSPCGERRTTTITIYIVSKFLSTLSLRRATIYQERQGEFYEFLSTLSLRRATCFFCVKLLLQLIFLSTLSLRRATRSGHICKTRSEHFYPRSPCGERPMMPSMAAILILFLSTLSLRRATIHHRTRRQSPSISIHALLAESDVSFMLYDTSSLIFLSTLSLRRATVHFDNYNLHCVISIHALLAESDHPSAILSNGREYFYPRSPCGERRLGLLGWLRTLISIHALLAESDAGD